MRKPPLALLVAILATLSACDRFTQRGKETESAGKPGATEPKKPTEKPADPIRVEALVLGPISETIETTGDLQAENWTDVVVRRAGLVEKLLVEEAQVVKHEAPLLELEQKEAKIAFDQAEAEAQQADKRAALAKVQIEDAKITVARLKINETKARAEFDRYNRLRRGVIQEEELESRRYERDRTEKEREAAQNALAQAEISAKIATAEHESAKLKVSKAQIDLDYAIPRAPFAGVISQRHVQAGQYLSTNQVAFTLVDVTRLRLDVNLPQRYLTRLRSGLPVTLVTEAFAGRTFGAELQRVSPVVGEKGTIKVTIEVKQKEVLLRPGMYVSATIVLNTRENALLASKRAVQYDTGGGAPFVFVVREDDGELFARKHTVDIGYRRAEQVQIIPRASDDPPRPGDEVIVAGQDNLRGGEAVRKVGVADAGDDETPAPKAPPAAAKRP